MQYTIHLTQKCNLKCKYCYQNKKEQEILFKDIQLLIDNEIRNRSKHTFITFYGGEPLLKKDLIYDTINYIKSIKAKNKFYFGITTNGTLLDEEFIKYMKKNNFLNVAYSFDGTKETQNLNRVTLNGEGTFDIVEKNALKLLKEYNDVIAMMVVTKNSIKNLSNNIEYLIKLGFENFNIQFNYLEDWQDEDLAVIEEQYSKVAEIYYNKILKEEDINISVFDEKIKTHVEGHDCNKDCNLGVKSINVGTDGNFYPCMQFVGDERYIIGNCEKGIDYYARKKLIEQSGKENKICKKCAIRKRCKHTCACRNYMTTKDINSISPIICEVERIVIKIADEMAQKLYEKNSKLFIQKYYNKNYNMFKEIIDNKNGDE